MESPATEHPANAVTPINNAKRRLFIEIPVTPAIIPQMGEARFYFSAGKTVALNRRYLELDSAIA